MCPFAPRFGLLGFVFVLCTVPACGPTRLVDDKEGGNLTLILPEFEEYLDRDPPRRNRLMIDGKETILAPELTGGKKVVKAAPAPGKDSIEVELSFWPVRYSNGCNRACTAQMIGRKGRFVNMLHPVSGGRLGSLSSRKGGSSSREWQKRLVEPILVVAYRPKGPTRNRLHEPLSR